MNGRDLDTPYQVNETFWSIQGEGAHAGETAVFVRLQGCPVGCHFCDSKLTWYAGGERLTVREILARVESYPRADWAVITGGEPLLYDLDPLLDALHAAFGNYRTQVETSGAYPYKGERRPNWTTCSPKAAAGWRVADTVLGDASELKYVIDRDYDPAVTEQHLAHALRWQSRPLVYLMPEGAPPRPENVARALALLRAHPRWRFGPRLQYDYAAIGEGEGLNNKIVTADEARFRARENVRQR